MFVFLACLILVLFLLLWGCYYYFMRNGGEGSYLVLQNYTSVGKSFYVHDPLISKATNEIFIMPGCTEVLPLSKGGMRDVRIEARVMDEPVTTVHFTYPCVAESCSSKDSLASAHVDIDGGYTDSVLIKTQEGDNVTSEHVLFEKVPCLPEYPQTQYGCVSPCSTDVRYCDKRSKLYKRTPYRAIARKLKTVELPFTAQTRYTIRWY
jgi:hypothetical protein